MDAQNYKQMYPNTLDFCEILKKREKIWKYANFFVCYCFILYKEKMLTDIKS